MDTIVGACPLDCPDACSWVVTVEDGIPVKLRGNPNHPHTRKGLCVKVNPYLEYTAHPDRLLYPMRRVGDKGAGKFQRITWDEAFEEIAHRLQDIIANHGAEAIWPYRGTGSMGILQGLPGVGQRFFNAIGASDHTPNICSETGYQGLMYTAGRGPSMDPMDVKHAKVILVWGSNAASTNQHYWALIKQAQKGGARVVVVDPVTTRTASRADDHLAIKPGTDGALALGLMSHLASEYDLDDGVAEALGWETFRDSILTEWSPRRASLECGIEERQVVALADLMATSGPTTIRLGMGMQRHMGGGHAVRLLSCLPVLTGDYRRLGGGLCYSTGPLFAINYDKLNRPDLASGPKRALTMTRLGEGLLELDDPPVKALFVIAANPVASNPEQARVRRGLSRDDLFCVVVDHFLTDTADYADIVLPATMQTEHLDIHDSVTHMFLNLNNPVAAAPGECLTHTEMFRRLSVAMKLKESCLFASDEDLLLDALDSEHPAVADIDIDELRSTGFVRLGYPIPFLPYAEQFDTPSGKFEFASEVAEADGLGLLPTYLRPLEANHSIRSTAADGQKSLALIAAASHYFLNSVFANSAANVKPGPPILAVHPEDAVERGFDDGEMVRVHNARGEFQAVLEISDKTRRGVAAMTKGHWPKLVGGTNANATTLETDADMARGAIFHDNQVFVSRSMPAGSSH